MGKVPSKILENLWLGPRRWHGDFGWFQENWPQGIVSCCTKSAIIPPELKKVIKQLKINVDDSPETNMTEWFVTATEFINEARIKGKCVYIHCAQGVSRSATICIAYMMLHANIKYENAYRFVEMCRDVILPNEGFVQQLKALDSRRVDIYTELKKKHGELWIEQSQKDWNYTKNLLSRCQNFSLPRESSVLGSSGKANPCSDKNVNPCHNHTPEGSPWEVLSQCKLTAISPNYDLLKNQDIREALNLDYQPSTDANRTGVERERNLIPYLNIGEDKEEIDSYESDFENGEQFNLDAIQSRSTINIAGDERASLKKDWDFATSLQIRHLEHAEDFQVKRDHIKDALETLRGNVVSKPKNIKRLTSRRLFRPNPGNRRLPRVGGT